VAHVQVTRRVRKHHKRIELGARLIKIDGAVYPKALPVGLPLFFYILGVILTCHAQKCLPETNARPDELTILAWQAKLGKLNGAAC